MKKTAKRKERQTKARKTNLKVRTRTKLQKNLIKMLKDGVTMVSMTPMEKTPEDMKDQNARTGTGMDLLDQKT